MVHTTEGALIMVESMLFMGSIITASVVSIWLARAVLGLWLRR